MIDPNSYNLKETIDFSIRKSLVKSFQITSIIKIILIPVFILISPLLFYNGGSNTFYLSHFLIPIVSMIIINISFFRFKKSREILENDFPSKILLTIIYLIIGLITIIISVILYLPDYRRVNAQTSNEFRFLLLFMLFLTFFIIVLHYFLMKSILIHLNIIEYRKYLLDSIYLYFIAIIPFIFRFINKFEFYHIYFLIYSISMIFSFFFLITESIFEYIGSTKILKSF